MKNVFGDQGNMERNFSEQVNSVKVNFGEHLNLFLRNKGTTVNFHREQENMHPPPGRPSEAVGQKPETVEPIKEYLYDSNKADGVEHVSRATCGPEPKVPEIPTPRPVGQETDVSVTTTKLPSSSSTSQLSVIVIIYLTSIYFTVTISCFQYAC